MSQKGNVKILNLIYTLTRNYSSTKSTVKSNSQYCLDIVRQWDYEGFVSSLLIPDVAQRTTAFAVRAFNVEVALVAQRVSNATIGQGRLVFWNNAVDQISQATAPQHPVAQEILRATQRHKLHRLFLQRLITCRQQQLLSPGFATLSDLEKYAEESMSPVLYLILQSAGTADVKVDHAASHLGKALGISNALRSLVRARGPSELSVPRDMLVKHSVSQESLLRGAGQSPGLRDAVFDIAACAKQHLDKARSLSTDVPKNLRVYFLPAMPVSLYLERLRLSDFDPFHRKLQQRSGSLPFSMWWSRLRKQY